MARTLREPLKLIYFGEDSETARHLIERLQRLEQCESVHAAADIVSLGALLERFPPDLILIDVGLTDESRRRYRPEAMLEMVEEMPIVALTARERENRGILAAQLGAQDYVCVDETGDEELAAVLAHAMERHRFVNRIGRKSDALRTILGGMTAGVMVIDREGAVVSLNAAARRLLGLGPHERPKTGWAARFCSLSADGRRELPEAERPVARLMTGQQFDELELRHRPDDGGELVLSVSGKPVSGADGEPLGGMLTMRDVTGRRRQAAARERAGYDPLTELPNRELFQAHLAKAIERSRRGRRGLGTLFVDLDRFKSVNDTLGFDIGDALLAEVAARLKRELRAGDFIGRWGGDAFVVAIEDAVGTEDLAVVAQKLVLALAEHYHIAGHELYVTPSVGIAIYPEAGESAATLVRAAERAMAQAKNRGGGRLQFFSAALNRRLEERDELELGLRHALVRRELTLHYQPRVDAGSSRLVTLEALLRWQHRRFGLLAPARFLPVLESSGLIHSVGEWVIETATAQLKYWQQRYEMPDLTVAVNVSPQQLLRGRLPEAVARALRNADLDPGCLELEVGESIVGHDRRRGIETLEALHALGVRLSLDHFGTEDVSFRSLNDGVVDTFVLHQSLVRNLTESDAERRLVRATIAMARGLDIEVAAEGVETEEQLAILRDSQCDIVQGFLIGRPMAGERVDGLLREAASHSGRLQRRAP